MTLRLIASVLAGGLLGYGWHRLVGCSSGACPITANPYVSTLWGAAIGAMLGMR
ncbi:MAG: DUF6132 family protein [Elusimicrobiota bacterium]